MTCERVLWWCARKKLAARSPADAAAEEIAATHDTVAELRRFLQQLHFVLELHDLALQSDHRRPFLLQQTRMLALKSSQKTHAHTYRYNKQRFSFEYNRIPHFHIFLQCTGVSPYRLRTL
jgi:hypothetical protein